MHVCVAYAVIVTECGIFFFQAEDGIRDLVRSRGLGDVYKRQAHSSGSALMTRYACIGCHSAGTVPGDKLQTLAERYTLAELADYFLLPTAPMPIFALNAAERRDLAIHLLDNPEN